MLPGTTSNVELEEGVVPATFFVRAAISGVVIQLLHELFELVSCFTATQNAERQVVLLGNNCIEYSSTSIVLANLSVH